MALNFIVACDENNGIGRDGTMPWHFKLDMKWFRETTTGHIVIMGRKTADSIGRSLPNRHNIIITRSGASVGCTPENYLTITADSASMAMKHVALLKKNTDKDLKIFVIGGTEIFNLFLLNTTEPLETLYLTIIEADFDCDVKFPFNLIETETIFEKVVEDTSEDKLYQLRFMKLNMRRKNIA